MLLKITALIFLLLAFLIFIRISQIKLGRKSLMNLKTRLLIALIFPLLVIIFIFFGFLFFIVLIIIFILILIAVLLGRSRRF
ncbi:MAG: hypothetical protein KJ674_02225 [Nanoarchaeota archaeon]|nr:hypothetical protein [Nanoarchaeota archaeon]